MNQILNMLKVGIRNIGDYVIESSSMFLRVSFPELVNATVFVFVFVTEHAYSRQIFFRFFGHLHRVSPV